MRCEECRYYIAAYNYCTYYGCYVDPQNPPCESGVVPRQQRRKSGGGGIGASVAIAVLTFFLLLSLAACALTYQRVVKLELENTKLKRELSQLQYSYQKLYARYTELSDRYERLKRAVQRLKEENSKLRAEVQSLLEANRRLESKYRELEARFGARYDVTEMHKFVRPGQVSSLVGSIVRSRNWWREVYRLYNYVVRHVRYRSDPTVPAFNFVYAYTDGQSYLLDVSVVDGPDEYYKYPLETLREGGDCEDQAILLCSMIEAYERYYLGTDYATFIVVVRFSDGSGHATVLIPVAGGEMTILDPAGHYATNCYLLGLCSRPIYEEWRRYQQHWHRYIVDVAVVYPSYKYFDTPTQFLNWLYSETTG